LFFSAERTAEDKKKTGKKTETRLQENEDKFLVTVQEKN
jgi:hypothetical protein